MQDLDPEVDTVFAEHFGPRKLTAIEAVLSSGLYSLTFDNIANFYDDEEHFCMTFDADLKVRGKFFLSRCE